jgi:N-acetylglucosamine-6-phosphate deacetylase
MLVIRQATIYTPDTVIEAGDVWVADGRIQAVSPPHNFAESAEAQVIEARGLLLAPGFIDLQCNGGFGHDFTQAPATIWPVASYLPRYGITNFLPTIITSPLSTIRQAQTAVADTPADFVGATPLGLHLEGPYLNPGKKGAHNPAYLRPPSPAETADWSPATAVRLVTLAPELPGAPAVSEALARQGVVVSAGHSLADYTQSLAGLDAGITYGTHLFNAMSPLSHREPGLVGALLADEQVTIGLIADGVHVHPALVKIAWQAAGARLNLVTDAMAALGMAPGRYRLGDHEVTIWDKAPRLPDGTLAGSVLSLDTAVRHFIRFTGCALPDALATVTTTPATLLGLGGQKGRIAPGYDADLVLLTPELEVVMTVVNGRMAYTADYHPLSGKETIA